MVNFQMEVIIKQYINVYAKVKHALQLDSLKTHNSTIKMNLEQIRAFLKTEFPQNTAIVDSVGNGDAVIHQDIDYQHLRPGNTVSGPTLMMLADCAVYVAIQGVIGPQPLAVTTNLNINFLRKPRANKKIIAKANLVKVGKRLIIGEVRIYSTDTIPPVAMASVTYSVPPD